MITKYDLSETLAPDPTMERLAISLGISLQSVKDAHRRLGLAGIAGAAPALALRKMLPRLNKAPLSKKQIIE